MVVHDTDALSAAQASALAEIQETTSDTKDGVRRTLRVKMHSKTAALDSLAKHFGIHAPTKVQFDFSKLTDEQLQTFLELRQKVEG